MSSQRQKYLNPFYIEQSNDYYEDEFVFEDDEEELGLLQDDYMLESQNHSDRKLDYSYSSSARQNGARPSSHSKKPARRVCRRRCIFILAAGLLLVLVIASLGGESQNATTVDDNDTSSAVPDPAGRKKPDNPGTATSSKGYDGVAQEQSQHKQQSGDERHNQTNEALSPTTPSQLELTLLPTSVPSTTLNQSGPSLLPTQTPTFHPSVGQYQDQVIEDYNRPVTKNDLIQQSQMSLSNISLPIPPRDEPNGTKIVDNDQETGSNAGPAGMLQPVSVTSTNSSATTNSTLGNHTGAASNDPS